MSRRITYPAFGTGGEGNGVRTAAGTEIVRPISQKHRDLISDNGRLTTRED